MTSVRFWWVVLLLSGLVAGCSPGEKTPTPPTDPQGGKAGISEGKTESKAADRVELSQLDVALRNAVEFLRRNQDDKDGAWRSDLYAAFKDGTALTPLVLLALQHACDAGLSLQNELQPRLQRGYSFLDQWHDAAGKLHLTEDQLEYPVYTAALILEVFSHPSAKVQAARRPAWVRYLKERQLTEALGWSPDDVHYGGWGYCRLIPYKPQPGRFAPAFTESNLSATVYALQGLAAADALDAETARTAMIFIRRMQNWGDQVPMPVRDGGFRFIDADPVRNKAGKVVIPPPADQKPLDQERPADVGFPSYGSMTADGYRALVLCQQAGAFDPKGQDDQRLKAAATWLHKHFQADQHPGAYVSAHEPNRNAVYYYYIASVARTFSQMRLGRGERQNWYREIALALLARQHPDGHWENPCELVRENEPLVATAQALIALSLCRKAWPPQ
ncbi:MAG: hypothetical protein NZU63_02750 [Gemmataceae bacterium]|nr:hypothetical protein [Gemmataceae bacterium]MDW8244217.1 prenyltransferase/squalene oxidase repeat-containing protein [Thermogemmata sp.]